MIASVWHSGSLVEPIVVVRKYLVQWIRPKPDPVKLAAFRRQDCHTHKSQFGLGSPSGFRLPSSALCNPKQACLGQQLLQGLTHEEIYQQLLDRYRRD